MEPTQAATFASFLAQTDAIGRTVLVLLALMSLATWYLIITKTIQMVTIRRRAARFLQSFWNAPSMQAVALRLAERGADEPFSKLSQARDRGHRVIISGTA